MCLLFKMLSGSVFSRKMEEIKCEMVLLYINRVCNSARLVSFIFALFFFFFLFFVSASSISNRIIDQSGGGFGYY